MKCPHCAANFSELRDICPGCNLDLRQYKERLEIPVSFPGISYEALLMKFPRNRPPQPAVEARPAHIPAAEESIGSPEDETTALFSRAFEEASRSSVREMNLGTAELGRTVSREEVNLLFEVLDDSLSKIAEYVDDVQTSESKFVESGKLQAELDKLEKMVEAPMFTLKGARPGVLGESAEQSLSVRQRSSLKPVFLTGVLRSLGSVVDGGIVVISSLVVSYFLLGAQNRELVYESVMDIALTYSDVLALASALLIPLSIAYLAAAGILWRKTVGLLLVGGKISLEDGKPPSAADILVRSMLAPPMVILFGFIPVLLGKRGWHDKLAKTDVLMTAA